MRHNNQKKRLKEPWFLKSRHLTDRQMYLTQTHTSHTDTHTTHTHTYQLERFLYARKASASESENQTQNTRFTPNFFANKTAAQKSTSIQVRCAWLPCFATETTYPNIAAFASSSGSAERCLNRVSGEHPPQIKDKTQVYSAHAIA